MAGKLSRYRGARALSRLVIIAAFFAAPLGVAGAPPSESLAASLRLSQSARDVLASDPARAATLAEAAGRLATASGGEPRARALAIATSQSVEGEASLRLNNAAAAKTSPFT